jgi:hypothetical protein
LKKIILLFTAFIFLNCNYVQLEVVAALPEKLFEVSGMEYNQDSDDFWMLNDGGNPDELYRVSKKGKITQTLQIDKKNHDWEDLTKDDNGNLYIADFGNNNSKRKNLSILIVAENQLKEKKAKVEEIKFSYPNQTDFPPKKKERYFDAESLLYFNNYLYIFTKSRSKNNFGQTTLYRIPAKKGEYIAELISSYKGCSNNYCWITSAAISPDKKKVVLLSQNKILVFTDFVTDDFLSGKVTEIELTNYSQKESISFKDNNTVYISDERAKGEGGNLYMLKLN